MRCAKCNTEYSDEYDACPACAKAQRVITGFTSAGAMVMWFGVAAVFLGLFWVLR